MAATIARSATNLMTIRLTPLYEPLACHEGGSELGEMLAGEEYVNISGTSKKLCVNHNAYPVTVLEGSRGPVYGKSLSQLLEIGMNTLLAIVIPSNGDAIGSTSMSFSVNMDLAMQMVELSELQIVTKVHMVSAAVIKILGLPLSSSQPNEHYCGFEIPLAEQKVGHILYVEIVESLYIQAVDNETMVEEYVHPDPDLFQHEVESAHLIPLL